MDGFETCSERHRTVTVTSEMPLISLDASDQPPPCNTGFAPFDENHHMPQMPQMPLLSELSRTTLIQSLPPRREIRIFQGLKLGGLPMLIQIPRAPSTF